VNGVLFSNQLLIWSQDGKVAEEDTDMMAGIKTEAVRAYDVYWRSLYLFTSLEPTLLLQWTNHVLRHRK
jgi:hypothetical protein